MKSIIAMLVCAVGLDLSQAAGQTLSNYQAIITAQGPSSYFTLDGTFASAVDAGTTLEVFGAGGFMFDLFRNPGSSYFYVNKTDFLRNLTTPNLISGGGTSNLTSTAAGSVTLLFRTLGPGEIGGQRYLFSAGSVVTNHNAFALFLENTNVANGDPNALKLRFGDSTATLLPAAKIVPSTWYYFAVTYLESRAPNKAVWYVGRPGDTLSTGQTTNSAQSVAGTATGLYIGNKETLDAAFRDPGSGQLDEFALWHRELSPAEVNAQFAALPHGVPPPASAYQRLVTSQSPSHYFKLDGSLRNEVASAPSLSSVGTSPGFGYDYFGNFETTNASTYTAANDGLVVNNNLLNGGGTFDGTPGTGAGTVSFLFNSLSGTNQTGQRFLFSAGGATGATNAFAVFMENWTASTDPGAIKVRLGNSSKAILPPQNIVPGEWYYCAVTYDESLTNQQVTWSIGQPGGTLNSGTLNFLAGVKAGDGNLFVVGNHTNFNGGWRSPGTGRIDEFAIWHRVLGAAEIGNQFAALSPSSQGASPRLTLTRSGGMVLLSWPASTQGNFVLEATNVLPSASSSAVWPGAGVATVVGPNFVVTNAIAPGNRFYRLRGP
jgi:hypothetical protein